MSHEIVSNILLVDHEGELLMAVKSASNNVSPRTPSWGFLVYRFENEAAAKGLMFAERLAGNFVFDSKLARVKRCNSQMLDPDVSRALERIEGRGGENGSGIAGLRTFTVAEAVGGLERFAANDYYKTGSLALAEQAIHALKTDGPFPNPNNPSTRRIAESQFPMLSSVSQYGLGAKALVALDAHPQLAKEVGPLGVTPLHRLANVYAFELEMQLRVMESVKALLACGANPSPRDVLGQTPLHHAAQSHTPMPELLKTLVQHGLDVNARDRHGNTALHVAAWHGRSKAAEAILALNPNASLRNQEGKTPAELATDGSDLRGALERAGLASARKMEQPALAR